MRDGVLAFVILVGCTNEVQFVSTESGTELGTGRVPTAESERTSVAGSSVGDVLTVEIAAEPESQWRFGWPKLMVRFERPVEPFDVDPAWAPGTEIRVETRDERSFLFELRPLSIGAVQFSLPPGAARALDGSLSERSEAWSAPFDDQPPPPPTVTCAEVVETSQMRCTWTLAEDGIALFRYEVDSEPTAETGIDTRANELILTDEDFERELVVIQSDWNGNWSLPGRDIVPAMGGAPRAPALSFKVDELGPLWTWHASYPEVVHFRLKIADDAPFETSERQYRLPYGADLPASLSLEAVTSNGAVSEAAVWVSEGVSP